MPVALRWMPAVLIASVLLVWATPPAHAQPAIDRAPDRVLTRPDLQAIVDLQVRRDAAALIDRLQADDPAVRARAAFALASVQDSAAISGLTRLLRDPNATVRGDAAFALGQMPGPVPADSLLDAVEREQDRTVQRRLLEALGKTGDAASLRRLVALNLSDTLAADVALAVARYGLRDLHDPAAVDWLVERLTHARPSVRQYAAYYFGRMTTTDPWAEHADQVRAALAGYSPNDAAAMHLVLGLGRLGRPGDTALLIERLRVAQDQNIRVNAVRALAGRGDSSHVRQQLISVLDDPSAHVAITAASALSGAESWTGEEARRIRRWVEAHPSQWRVVAPLLPGLARAGEPSFVVDTVERWRSEQPAPVYARALPALAAVDSAQAWGPLVEAAQHEDARVAYAALQALAERWSQDRMTGTTSPARVSAYYEAFAQGIERGDIATVNAAAPALTDSLFAPYDPARILVDTYRTLTTPDDIEAMTAILSALGGIDDPVARRVLREASDHPHPVVRTIAARALETLTGVRAALPDTTEPPERTIDWGALKALGNRPRLVLDTNKGRVVLELYTDQAPLTVQTITGFAEAGRYDGVPFHRVVPNFVVQGGDFARADGWGGPGFSIRSEFTRIPYRRGVLGMASAGKDTEGSQYFITHSMQPHLDGRYTAFGRVVSGLGVMDQLYEQDTVEQATVERAAVAPHDRSTE